MEPTMVALFGRYEYECELGRGATGRVFAVRDLAEGGAARAIKVVAASHAALLVWEFERLCRLEHPRIARVRELLRVDAPVHAPFRLSAPLLLLVEDRAAGVPLSALQPPSDPMERQRLVVRVALSVAEGLRAVHRAGLVHGDVKPDNLLVVAESGDTTLIDLGFCGPPGMRHQVRGTPRYLAPELLAGLSSAAADVYALGASLFDWLAGDVAGSSESRSGDGLHVRNLDALRGGPSLPALLEALALLLEPDPARRPPDGSAVSSLLVPVAQKLGVLARNDPALLSLGPSGDAEAARARTLPFVGHAESVSRLEAVLRQHGNALVTGPRGAGRSRLVREAVRRLALHCVESGRAPPTLLRSLEGLAQLDDVPAILWLAPAEADAARELEAALRSKALRPLGLTIVLEGALLSDHPAATRIELGPLEPAAFETLLARSIEPRAVTPALRAAAQKASQGFAGRLCNWIAEVCARQIDLGDAHSFSTLAGQDSGNLSPVAYTLASLCAWLGGTLSPSLAQLAPLSTPEREAAFAELWARGLIVQGGAGLELEPAAARELRALSLATRAELVLAVPAAVSLDSGFLLFARGQLPAAERAFLERISQLKQAGEVEAAHVLVREAAQLLPTDALRLEWADRERAAAQYRSALAVLSDARSAEARLLKAEVQRLCGERSEARVGLSLLRTADDPLVRDAADACLARTLFDAGELEAAKALADGLATSPHGEAALRAAEVSLLVALATGLPESRQADALVRAAEALAQPRSLARALLLRAHVGARHGAQAAALSDAARALAVAQQAGESHEAASAGLNLGLLQAEAGELGLALATLSAAAFRLARIDRPSDLTRVLFNLSALSLLIGDITRAEALLEAAKEPAQKASDPAASAFLSLTRAELWLKSGLVEKAASELETALSELPDALRPIRAVLAARAAQTELVRGDLVRASALVATARACCSDGDVSVELEVVVAEVRERLAAGANTRAEELVQRALPLISARAPLAERLRFLLAAIDAARAAEREREARERTLLCRALLEAALGTLPPSARGKLRERPEYARVLAAAVPLSQSIDARRGDRWRRLVASARRLFASADRRQIADQVVELALELVHGERAFLVACLEDGALELRAKAELGPGSEQSPSFSRSVVERVWSERRPLITLEASSDARLHAAQSILALSVRSVLAVPIGGFGEASVLYLDDRLRADAFNAEDLALLEDLAALAREALRVAQTRKAEAQRARKAEHEASSLTRALLSTGVEDEPNALVGVSAALQKVTSSARRVARSDVSLLITGQSGTGKELLARLVHRESLRRAQPFVAESCAALPDTLLESALFGHVRGAFTGADRPRRGLFEAADKGTLFLDEVGEMSAALQAKLLRVLQEGEFRPLGSERTRKVDVRVIAATRADLRARVREGGFREDLFYRLAVVTLELPPLSARREDIPLLVRFFLTKHQSRGRNVTITAAALRAFSERDYPGNVRQLENEVRRALALSDGARIDASDVPANEAELSGAPDPAGLNLHAQLDALGARLVDEALARASGNVTQAAELLGISRFGLQKMLKRRSATKG